MASKRHVRRHQCGKKYRYADEATAKAAAFALFRQKGGPLRDAYRCRWCRWYHIGRRPK